jgi:hypothetical protein
MPMPYHGDQKHTKKQPIDLPVLVERALRCFGCPRIVETVASQSTHLRSRLRVEPWLVLLLSSTSPMTFFKSRTTTIFVKDQNEYRSKHSCMCEFRCNKQQHSGRYGENTRCIVSNTFILACLTRRPPLPSDCKGARDAGYPVSMHLSFSSSL